MTHYYFPFCLIAAAGAREFQMMQEAKDGHLVAQLWAPEHVDQLRRQLEKKTTIQEIVVALKGFSERAVACAYYADKQEYEIHSTGAVRIREVAVSGIFPHHDPVWLNGEVDTRHSCLRDGVRAGLILVATDATEAKDALLAFLESHNVLTPTMRQFFLRSPAEYALQRDTVPEYSVDRSLADLHAKVQRLIAQLEVGAAVEKSEIKSEAADTTPPAATNLWSRLALLPHWPIALFLGVLMLGGALGYREYQLGTFGNGQAIEDLTAELKDARKAIFEKDNEIKNLEDTLAAAQAALKAQQQTPNVPNTPVDAAAQEILNSDDQGLIANFHRARVTLRCAELKSAMLRLESNPSFELWNQTMFRFPQCGSATFTALRDLGDAMQSEDGGLRKAYCRYKFVSPKDSHEQAQYVNSEQALIWERDVARLDCSDVEQPAWMTKLRTTTSTQ